MSEVSVNRFLKYLGADRWPQRPRGGRPYRRFHVAKEVVGVNVS